MCIWQLCEVFLCMCAHLAAIEAQPWLLTVREHLPESDSEHPRVGGMRERPRLQAFWSAPARMRAADFTVRAKEKVALKDKTKKNCSSFLFF